MVQATRIRYELRVGTLVSKAALATFRIPMRHVAVPRKTVFVMTVTPGNAVAVSLKAYRDGAAVTTFDKELFLTLPYGKFVHGLYRTAALVKHASES